MATSKLESAVTSATLSDGQRVITCRAETNHAGGQVVVVGPIAAPLPCAEAAVDALTAQDAYVAGQVRIDGLLQAKLTFCQVSNRDLSTQALPSVWK